MSPDMNQALKIIKLTAYDSTVFKIRIKLLC